MPSTMNSLLKGKWIVITRPAHQSKNLEEKLRKDEANVILFPLLEINPPKDQQKIKKKLAQLSQYQLLIFVSANAVEQCFKLISVQEVTDLNIAVVGKKTEQTLNDHGLKACCIPQAPFNSEALLALSDLKKLGKNDKVAIIRGAGGRDFLKIQLQAQGVHVDYFDVYERSCPQNNLDILNKYAQQKKLDIILLTSVESANNLFDLQAHEADNAWLKQVELIVGSARIKQKILSDMSFVGKVTSANDPSDETLYQQLIAWAKKDGLDNAS